LLIDNADVLAFDLYLTAVAPDDLFTSVNIRIVRPGNDAHPHLYWQLLGRLACQDYSCGTPLSLDQML